MENACALIHFRFYNQILIKRNNVTSGKITKGFRRYYFESTMHDEQRVTLDIVEYVLDVA
jgi:hypothetical protein